MKYQDPVLEQLRGANKAAKKRRNKRSEKIAAAERKREAREKKRRKRLLFNMRGVAIPPSPKVFKQAYHFPPVAQYLTGTCWSYSATSFFESEVARQHKRRIKLSEQHTVYYEYLAKVRRWLAKRGHSAFSQGSENNAVTRILEEHGAMPLAAYPGVMAKNRRHNHVRMAKQIRQYLEHCKEVGQWDAKVVIPAVRALLDKVLGHPPSEFSFEGKRYTPRRFLRDVLKLDLNAYVEVMSTKLIPFWTVGEFNAPDNWWRSRDYHNVPLGVFYGLITSAVGKGYTVAIGGDVSEPGKNGFKDAAVIPSDDIPQASIHQDSREYRIDAKATTDDHGLHLVGHVNHAGRDWFLLKDSGRSSRMGKAKGYYYFRDDFIKLKMLTLTVHKDVLGKLLKRFRRPARTQPKKR
ncbi:MAG: peptidase C1 [Deltaproteobacteria bacterium]|nr:peptidase C1 [Deltaproteobacteria bacterium]